MDVLAETAYIRVSVLRSEISLKNVFISYLKCHNLWKWPPTLSALGLAHI